jgi:type II secretory pathway component PulF
VLSRMVEPAILLLLGLVVGGVAFSLFLPLFDIATAASGG